MLDDLPRRAYRKIRRTTLRALGGIVRPARAAVIGCGAVGLDHIDAFEQTGRVRLVAVCDQNGATLGRTLDALPGTRGYLDYSALLAEHALDLVAVCTWPRLHAPMVLAAARSRVKAILCEKPMALSVDDVDAMLAACRERSVKLAIGHQHRFNPRFALLAEQIGEGALGTLESVIVSTRGALINNGIHSLDLVRYLLGDPAPSWVEAQRCDRVMDTWDRGVATEDEFIGTVSFAGGVACEVRSGPAHLPTLEVRIVTSRGVVIARPHEIAGQGLRLAAPLRAGTTSVDPRPVMLKELLLWIAGRSPDFRAEGRRVAPSTEAVLALYEAARVGRRVALPLTSRGPILDQLWLRDPEIASPREARAL
jgi:predicted dehydrogenase